MAYFIRIKGRSFGPFEENQLMDMKSKGKISANTEVSYDNEFWFSARTLSWLYSPESPQSLSPTSSTEPPSPQSPGGGRHDSYGPYDDAPRPRAGSPPWAFICLGVLFVLILLLGIGLLMPDGKTPAPVAKSEGTSTKSIEERPLTTVPTGKHLASEEIVDRYSPSVARIIGKTSGGTGWLIRPNIIATNRHVIEGEIMELTEVTFPSAKPGEKGPYQPVLQYIDPKLDLAFLEVKTPLPPLTMAQNYQFRPGRDIIVIGSPEDSVSDEKTLENAVSKGVLSSQTKRQNVNYYQLGVSVNHGNSGGPVFDTTGSVIGVLTLRSSYDGGKANEGLAYCIPSDDVVDSLKAMQKLSSAEKDKFNSKQRAKVLATWIMIQHRLNVEIKRSVLVANKLKSQGVSKDEVDNLLDKQLKGVQYRALLSRNNAVDVEKELTRVVDDSLLDHAVRKDLKEFYHAMQQVDNFFRGNGSVKQFETNFDKCAELEPKLRIDLGISEGDVDVFN